MNTFVMTNSKQIRREKVLTGIIPEDTGNMIHDSRTRL